MSGDKHPASRTDGAEIFLTGATGFIGSSLLAKWLDAEPDARVTLLVRPRRGVDPQVRAAQLLTEICPGSDAAVLADRVSILAGDISLPNFGLGAAEYGDLAKRTSHIIHCAAAVRFDLPLEEARATNVVGSENAIALARACKRLRRLDYVGTAYVAGTRTGTVREDELDKGQEHRNSYEKTKLESERLMRRAAGDLPITILRPSIVICDSRTGRISRYSAFSRVLRTYCLGHLKALPGDPATGMDIVPMDYLADAVYAITHSPGSAGKCYHLAAGPAALTSLDEVVTLAAEHFGREKLAVVPPATFDAMVAARAGRLSEEEQALVDEIRIYQPYLTTTLEFDNANALEVTERAGIRLPPLRSYFGKMAAHIRNMA
jgi:thioester reductase-like protein